MKKILGIGNALVDIMTLISDDSVLESFSLPKGSMQLVDSEKSELVKNKTSEYKKRLTSGGSAANTIHGLAMLGAKTAFIGSIGKDKLGDFFENDMKSAGIKTILSRRNSATGTAVSLISTDYERTFATHLGAAVEMEANDLPKSVFKGYNILYIEGYQIFNKPLIDTACSYAKNENMKIALDLASYNIVESNLSDFREIVEKYVDILFANEDEARAFTGMDPEGALGAISKICEVAVVKIGSGGSWIKRESEIIRIGPAKADVKDTTGAGDLYAAGFLYGYSLNKSLEICGRYGSLMAGKVIEILGARMDNTKWDEIKTKLPEIG
jgi:sugar/nucleoside kinase (ribokinase family)